jgi:hypothetical protein
VLRGRAKLAGKDAFHRVPDFTGKEWDAVERVLTLTGEAAQSSRLTRMFL